MRGEDLRHGLGGELPRWFPRCGPSRDAIITVDEEIDFTDEELEAELIVDEKYLGKLMVIEPDPREVD